MRLDETKTQNKIKNATDYLEKLILADPNQPMIKKAQDQMKRAKDELNVTRTLITQEQKKRDKLLKESFEFSKTFAKRANIVLEAQIKAGIPNKLNLGYNPETLTTLELIFIIIFVLLVTNGLSLFIYRKYLFKNMSTIPGDNGEFTPNDQMNQEEIERANKIMNVMNNTLETIANDIEKSKSKLNNLKNQMDTSKDLNESDI